MYLQVATELTSVHFRSYFEAFCSPIHLIQPVKLEKRLDDTKSLPFNTTKFYLKVHDLFWITNHLQFLTSGLLKLWFAQQNTHPALSCFGKKPKLHLESRFEQFL